MSKIVDEILTQIYKDKDSWRKEESGRLCQLGIRKENILINNVGNTALLSIVDLFIDGMDMPISYFDKYRLEKAVNWWYRNISLETASKK